jgi:hypothetical protein
MGRGLKWQVPRQQFTLRLLGPVLALMECRLELTSEENQRHLSRTSESKWACTFLQPFEDKSH